jgi:ParB family chromosome partitioning protein
MPAASPKSLSPQPVSQAKAAPPKLPAIGAMVRKMVMVPLKAISADDKNHRLATRADEAALAELTRSIETNGLLSPVLLYPDPKKAGRWHLVCGFRRRDAVALLRRPEIPAYTLDYTPNDQQLQLLRAVENLHRKDLNPAEEAIAVGLLVDAHAGNVQRVAADLGKLERWVSDRFYIFSRLSTKVRDEMVAGRINLGQARELVKCPDHRQQETWARTIVDDGKNRGMTTPIEEVRRWVENLRRPLATVHWRLEVPFANKPACVECPYNTAYERTLFGTEKRDKDAFCTFDPCYNAKMAAAGAEERKAAQKIVDQVKTQKVARESAGTITMAREVTPPMLRPEAVQQAVKVHLGPDKTCSTSTPATTSTASTSSQRAAPPKPAGPTDDERRQAAILQWSGAYRAWREEQEKRITAAAATSPFKRLALVSLSFSPLLETHEVYPLPHSTLDFGGRSANPKLRGAKAPPVEDAVSPKLARLIDLAGSGKPESLLEMAEAIEVGVLDTFQHAGPELIARVAKAFGAPHTEPPAFEDFLPEDLRPAPAPVADVAHAHAAAGTRAAVATRAAKPADAPKGKCWKCGCTADAPCEGGCTWADERKTICTRCVPLGHLGPGIIPCRDLGLQPIDVDRAEAGYDLAKHGGVGEVLFAWDELPLVIVDKLTEPPEGHRAAWRAAQAIPLDRWHGGDTLDPHKGDGRHLLQKGDFEGIRVFAPWGTFVLIGRAITLVGDDEAGTAGGGN